MGTVSCVIIRNVLTAIRETGGDERRVMAELDLSPKSLDDPDARFDMGVVERLWKLAPEVTNDDAFGLHAGERRDRGSHGIVEFWIGASPTFREGLERFCRFYGLLSDVGTLELVDDGKTARLSLRLAKGPIRQAAEYFMAVVITVIRRQVGHPIVPMHVAFAHDAPADTREHRRLFGVTPRFRAPANEVAFDAKLLDRPLVTADPALAKVLEPVVASALARVPKQEDELSRIRAEIMKTLGAGTGSLPILARSLGTSARSLQRVLAANDTTYHDVVDGVRHELALRYLAEGRLSLHEIAFFLGFSQVSAFHRAFKRWTGMTPSAWRAHGDSRSA